MKIFLSVPFSSRVDDNGLVNTDYRAAIEDLIKYLRGQEHKVFCALEHAEWKMGGLALPEEEFKKDLSEIDGCDKLIVLLEERVSAGVQLENGYAFAKGKPMEIFQIGKSAWSNLAFARFVGHSITPVEGILDFVHQVKLNHTGPGSSAG